MVKIEYLGSNIIENQPFKIDRPEGSYRYIFFHFVYSRTNFNRHFRMNYSI